MRYGFFWRLGMPEQYDLLEDALKNTDMVIPLGQRPGFDPRHLRRPEAVLWRYWLRDLGKKQIIIDPFCNFTASILGDKLDRAAPRHRRRHGRGRRLRLAHRGHL
jgi:trimethylamine-N-oxide reductase (cytochrome c)